MTFRDILYRREKRTFTVLSIDGSRSGVARYHDEVSTPKLATIAEISGAEALAASNIEHKPLQVVDIAGIDQALGKLNKFLSNFNRQFDFPKLSRSPAVLIHGGSGTGKTYVLDKIASTEWGKVRKIDRKTKHSEVQKIFRDSKINQPSIIIIDNIESVVTKNGEPLLDITEAICEGLEDLVRDHPPNHLPQVLVAAATSDVLKVPASLRKRGMFTTAIALPVPDVVARKAILKSLDPQMLPETRGQILDDLGERTHAYTPEDLTRLLDEAQNFAQDRLDGDDSSEEKYIIKEDIEHALLEVRPSAMHDVTLRPPKVKWSDIGGQDKVKEAIQQAIETPLHVSYSQSDFFMINRNTNNPPAPRNPARFRTFPNQGSPPLRTSRMFQNTHRASRRHRNGFQLLRRQRCRTPLQICRRLRTSRSQHICPRPRRSSKYHILR